MSNVIHVTDGDFEQVVLKAAGPVLVDYWAEWCGPCKMIAPILDELSKDYKGKLTVVKINIDEKTGQDLIKAIYNNQIPNIKITF